MQTLKTANGHDVPMVGFGTFPLQGNQMTSMIIESLKVGFRLIDTADDYRGETGIGGAIKNIKDLTGLDRKDIFIQTKISQDNAHGDEPLEGIWFNNYSKYQKRHTVEEVVREKVSISLRELQTDYIDSLLIHYPFPGFFEEIWEIMMKLQKEGVVRYIGVSNFHISHMKVLASLGKMPDINEIYVSPIGIKTEDFNFAEMHNVQLMTYSPLMDMAARRIDTSALEPIAEKYGKTIAQVLLRWNIDRGSIPLPKTRNPKRLADNFNVFDFCLTREEIELINSLNYDNQMLVESKQCPGL